MIWEKFKTGYYKSGKYMIYKNLNWWYAYKELPHEQDKIYDRWEYLSMHPTLKAAQFWVDQLPKNNKCSLIPV